MCIKCHQTGQGRPTAQRCNDWCRCLDCVDCTGYGNHISFCSGASPCRPADSDRHVFSDRSFLPSRPSFTRWSGLGARVFFPLQTRLQSSRAVLFFILGCRSFCRLNCSFLLSLDCPFSPCCILFKLLLFSIVTILLPHLLIKTPSTSNHSHIAHNTTPPADRRHYPQDFTNSFLRSTKYAKSTPQTGDFQSNKEKTKEKNQIKNTNQKAPRRYLLAIQASLLLRSTLAKLPGSRLSSHCFCLIYAHRATLNRSLGA